MLELFARIPLGVEVWPGQEVVPVVLESSVISLSAILLDQEFYDLVLSTRYESYGIQMVGANGLIPMKALAYLDLDRRRTIGQHVDHDDIKKHRNDVFRLALTLPNQQGPILSPKVLEALRSFVRAHPDDSPEWASIRQALRGTVRTPPSPKQLLTVLSTYFGLTET